MFSLILKFIFIICYLILKYICSLNLFSLFLFKGTSFISFLIVLYCYIILFSSILIHRVREVFILRIQSIIIYISFLRESI